MSDIHNHGDVKNQFNNPEKVIIYNQKLPRRSKRLIKDLAPYYTDAEIFQASYNYIQTRYQNVAPSEDEEPGRSYIATFKEKMIPLFLKRVFNNAQNDHRYYLILADAGMGKTTFMINLYLAYIRQWKWWNRRYDMRVLPLGHPATLQEVQAIPVDIQKDTILLLDAFDEDAAAVQNYEKRMLEILDRVWRFRSIIITCRTQFFPSSKEEPSRTGIMKFGGKGGSYEFQKLYISTFDDNDIEEYLCKQFPYWGSTSKKKKKKAKEIIEKSPKLSIRPMLLSHIEELVDQNTSFDYSYQIYQVMIQKWIEREAGKPHVMKNFEDPNEFKEKLAQFTHDLAINLYRNQQKRKGLLIHKDEKILSEGGLQLSDFAVGTDVAIKDSDWRTRSLLNRNAEGFYKFSHKSILEYILAVEIFDDLDFRDRFQFKGLDTVRLFFNEMAHSVLHDSVPISRPSVKGTGPLKIDHRRLVVKEVLELRSLNIVQLKTLRSIDLDGIHQISIINEDEFPNLYLIYFLRKINIQQVLLENESTNQQNINQIVGLIKSPVLIKHLELSQLHEVRKKGFQEAWLKERQEWVDLLNRSVFRDLKELADLREELQGRQRTESVDPYPALEPLDENDVQYILKIPDKFRRLRDLEKSELSLTKKLIDELRNSNSPVVKEFERASIFLEHCQVLSDRFPTISFTY